MDNHDSSNPDKLPDKRDDSEADGQRDQDEKPNEVSPDSPSPPHILSKRALITNKSIKPPLILITGGPDKLKKPSGIGSNPYIPGAISAAKNDTRTKQQKENSAAIHQTAKWSTAQLKKAQAEQAAKAKADAEAKAKAAAAAKAQTEKLKQESEDRLKKIREADAQRAADRAKAQAALHAAEKSEADAEARSRAEADQKAKAVAAAKQKADAEAKEKIAALFASAGVLPVPRFSPEMVTAANSAMGATDALVLGDAADSMQLSAAWSGVWTAAGETIGAVESAIVRALASLNATALSSMLGPQIAVATAALWPLPAGEESQADIDRQTGRSWDAVFAVNANLIGGIGVTIEPGMTSVNLPARGNLVCSNGQLALQLLKTGSSDVPAAVQILNSVRDNSTGLDSVTVPAVAGAPARTILINPAPAGPSAPLTTGNPAPVPVTPVHTGTTVNPIKIPLTTITTAAEAGSVQDFIYWRPNAAGTGVEPVYVMLSDPRLMPGKVTGKGEPVESGWLNSAGLALGAAIPAQIADKLRGRVFSSFNSFRRALWNEVGKDPELLLQMNELNKLKVKGGKSPFVSITERTGGRKRLELHHIKLIKDNGAVYDIDNIRIVTPKRHIDIHKEAK